MSCGVQGVGGFNQGGVRGEGPGSEASDLGRSPPTDQSMTAPSIRLALSADTSSRQETSDLDTNEMCTESVRTLERDCVEKAFEGLPRL